MQRTLVITILAALLASAVQADVLVVQDRRGKIDILGLPSEVDGQPVTAANWKQFAIQSTGIIDEDNYDGVLFKKHNRDKGTFYPRSEVKDFQFTEEPQDLLNGFDSVALGNYAQAIGDFRAVLADGEARTVFQKEASYQIGLCYLFAGNLKNTVAHFQRWDGGKSKYTPVAHRLLGEIYTSQRMYGEARQSYQQIGQLPDITPNWRYLSRLGAIKVDIAERKFEEAERTAKSTAAELVPNPELADALALAYGLQGQAIRESGARERLPEAQAILEKARELTGVSTTNRAFLHNVLGDVLYAQGKVSEARFPYMFCALMFPSESSYVAHALRNAGQCFIDLSDQAKNKGDQNASDEHLVKGMHLLGRCASRHRGTGSAAEAASVYGKRRTQFEEAQKRLGLAEEAEAPSGGGGEGEGG